jgi:hypothetical protein
MDSVAWLALQWVVVAFIGLVGLVIVIKLFTDKIDLNTLLSEPDGKASLSRFQLLLFTFVIASIYVVICLQQGELQEISNGVLGLMGISGGSYVISKGIQTQGDKDKRNAAAKTATNAAPVPGGGV